MTTEAPRNEVLSRLECEWDSGPDTDEHVYALLAKAFDAGSVASQVAPFGSPPASLADAIRGIPKPLPGHHERFRAGWESAMEAVLQLFAEQESGSAASQEAAQPITLEIEREADGRWLAEFHHSPGCLAYGSTLREAVVNALNLLDEAGTPAKSEE